MNLSSLRNQLRNRIGNPTSDAFFPPYVLNDVINQALHDLDEEAFWPWTEQIDSVTVDPTTPTIPLSVQWRATKALLWVDNYELTPVTSSEAGVWPGYYSGRPMAYAVLANELEVKPVPTSPWALTHIYYEAETELINDTDVPLLPDRFAPVVVAKAAELCMLREGDQPRATAHLTEYTSGLLRMRRSMRSTTKPVKIRVRPGGWIS